MTVLVCIPYFRTPLLVERAVRSVLAQTHRDLVCVVVGDGEAPPLPPIADDRLVVYSYPTNRGAYFAQDVAIWASPFEWYAPVASDDWLDPRHLEEHLELGVDACAGAVMAHGGHCGDQHPEPHGTCSPRVIRKAFEVGMYRTERYREIGAHNPGERLGQDSLTLRVMRIVAPVEAKATPTYHRLWREGSLSTSADTKKRSPAREEMRRRNRTIVARCEDIAASGLARRDAAVRAARIRRYRRSLVPPRLQAELNDRVAGLGRLLGGRVGDAETVEVGERGPERFVPVAPGYAMPPGTAW